MVQSLNNSLNNATTKRAKINRAQPTISRKLIAFEELKNLNEKKMSDREIARILEMPNSTMQSWRKKSSNEGAPPELEEFFSTPVGSQFLQRNVLAAMKQLKCGATGIRGMQEYLQNSGLSHFVASSEGALQKFWVRCEKSIIEFGEHEEKKSSMTMKSKKITVGLDEMFRGLRPCLVAIEVVSNYILLEKFTEDRKAETWLRELEPRLKNLNLKVMQVVSDLAGAIRLATKKLKAEHIPELFHAQNEISKATSFALSCLTRTAENALKEAEDKLQRVSNEPRSLLIEKQKTQKRKINEATVIRDGLKIEFELKEGRQKEVSAAVREMGKIHHPIHFKCGKLQTAAQMQSRFNEQFKLIIERAKDANLSEKCFDRIEKAQRAFDAIVDYMKYFFIMYTAFVKGLELTKEQEMFFNEIVFPWSYLKVIWRRFPKDVKEENQQLLKDLEIKIRDGPWPEEFKEELKKKGKEIAQRFQRSSSCVEGRNSILSLYYHRFRRLNKRSLKVLTIIHNFDRRGSDGTTPAERLFGAKHEDLFETLVANVRIPSRPQKQYHDEKRRQLGWEKRRAA